MKVLAFVAFIGAAFGALSINQQVSGIGPKVGGVVRLPKINGFNAAWYPL